MQLPTSAPDDILDTLEPASLPTHEFPWIPVLIVVSAAVLTALLVYAWRRRHRPLVSESLEHLARRRLNELSAADPRGFHTGLAAILTQYAEQRLGLRGTRLTSAEILREFRDNGVMSVAWQESLAVFLRECDRAKFAPSVDIEWDPRTRIAQCRALLDELAATAAASPHLANPFEEWTTP